MAPTSVNVNPEDRLFHLILALMATGHGLTKDHILTTVRGYREDTEAGMARESIERRFERDKDALRELGIPLEAVIPPEDDGNNKNTLYRIPKGEYEIPDDVRFGPRDIALLNVAAAVWREGSLSKDAHNARLKMASFGVSIDEPLLGFAPIVSTREPAMAPLRDAIERGFMVSFDYLKPGETEASHRVVSPFALVNHEGRWHLYAKEATGARAKTFLLRRIVSTATVLTDQAEPSPQDPGAVALEELCNVWERQVATLRVTPGSDAHTALVATGATPSTSDSLLVHYTDRDIFAEEIVSWGKEVQVVEPEDLKARVIALLQGLVKTHG